MSIKIADAALLALCNLLVDRIDAGAGAGSLGIYSGTQPADPDAVITDTELGNMPFADPAFGAAAIVSSPVDAAEAVGNPLVDETSATAGTAGWCSIEDSDGNPVISGTCTGIGSGGDLELSSLTIPAAGTITITSAKIRVTRNAA